MPTYNQAYFIRRAIISLQKQTYVNWELIIIDDGSTDNTYKFIEDLILSHKQISYYRLEKNQGLGYALNQGMQKAKYDYIAYLPSDDYYYPRHLQDLIETLNQTNQAILAFSGIKFEESNSLNNYQYTKAPTIRNKYCLQLVQVMHKKTDDIWVERKELVTEDLFIMFWKKLLNKGLFIPTLKVSCEWASHANQRHKICSETFGGNIYKYKSYYQVDYPVRIRMSKYKIIDEFKMYSFLFHQKKRKSNKKLRILLVGALSYNPERICALEEQEECELYGLWIPFPRFGFEATGHFPFSNIKQICYDEFWIENIKKMNPDLIYGLACTSSYLFVREIIFLLRKNNIQIPFVWHFKEGPQICMRNSSWNAFIELFLWADGNIFLNPLTKEWIEQFIPSNNKPSMILDQDPPKMDCFTDKFSHKLSETDGEIHTVVAGRMIGLSPQELGLLARNGIHVHLYSESYHSEKEGEYARLKKEAPNHFHIHKQCPTNRWVEEFSQYDAGWLHCFDSENEGDILRLSWDDINIPARMGVLAAAGIPMIQKDNTGNRVATQEILEEKGVGILFHDIADLVTKLHDHSYMEERSRNVMKNRAYFAFDSHVPELIAFFKEVIKTKKENGNR